MLVRFVAAALKISLTLVALQTSLSPGARDPLCPAIRHEIDRWREIRHTRPNAGDDLEALYRSRGDRPLWVDARLRPTELAWTALAMIAGAANEGLDPNDYGVQWLEPLTWRLSLPDTATELDASRFDVGLSAGMLAYLHDLHSGRVDPRRLGFQIVPAGLAAPIPALLRTAVANHAVEQLAAELSPPFAQYRMLRDALADYRRLAALGLHVSALPPVVRTGDRLAEAAGLASWLRATKDLTSGPVPSDVYDGPLVDAIRAFQMRHGLDPDGVIGPRTAAALRISPAERIRQIELSMERLRWLPDLGTGRVIAINVPMFRLWAWDAPLSSPVPQLTMKVIVGDARATRTPVFVADLRDVVFHPFWDVPRSITRQELIPAIRKDPAFLVHEDMDVIARDGALVTPLPTSTVLVAGLSDGRYRLRQRPGDRNPLGRMKFVFPNDDSIYMHDTPLPALFARARRDFSHGCIRLEDPSALATWVLSGTSGWNPDRIVGAAAGNVTARVAVADPPHVVIFYATAVVMPDDGSIHFADDLYGHDAVLQRALDARAR